MFDIQNLCSVPMPITMRHTGYISKISDDLRLFFNLKFTFKKRLFVCPDSALKRDKE